ncbi:NB-ARC domain-containing protein [Streptomyces kunmingensis]|uniref:NB-ARC domain-containing protein n=1 Tax=Streptomyces kunmingensis TaxID=68225 RepID=A0ABU6CBC8_9ACTN|nr:NB-ARC domain-containing protein [Streptomyces kunmingensis]MEB3961506.1 NB-ARC domain-containing protein [Streptomyces kunmingensis]
MKTRLVGRRAELAEIQRRYGRAATRLVTLTGVGGVGKTRLALEAADVLQHRFRDGAWLVDLSPLRQGTVLAHVIAEALPLADQTTRPMLEVLADFLAERELLLVLDTCEHLTEACATTADALLRAAPQLRILATSRRALNVCDEQVFTVQPLAVPEIEDDPQGEADAVTLLAERAAEAVRDFTVTDANRADLVRLCRRLDGLPLAIELAAARLRELPVQELTARLEDRFAVLGTTDRVVDDAEPPWHQALRTAIGWSHQLCTPAQRLLWARLSVFAGNFDAEAAGQVCADERLPDNQLPQLLGALVDDSLLIWQPTGGGERYRMLDSVREFGAHWLHGLGEETLLRRRHRDYYHRLARRGCAEWAGPDQVLWCDRATTEHANMRVAMDFCLTEPDGTALDMAGCLGFLWRHCGFPRDGQRYLDLVLTPDPRPGPERTWALFARGSIAFARGDLQAGSRWGEACADAAARPGYEDPDAAVAAAAVLGMSLAMRGELTRAAKVLDAAPQGPVRDVRYRIAPLQVRLSRLYTHLHMREFDRARVVADELRADCRRYGERWVCAYADYLRALVDLAHGKPHLAAEHARMAMEGHWLLHNSTGTAVVLDALASAVVADGDGEHAAWLLGLGQHVWRTLGSTHMDSPGLIAIRQACEHRTQQAIGDTRYEAAFRKGLESSIDEGITSALQQA